MLVTTLCASARITYPSSSTQIRISPKSLTLTEDKAWSPRIQGNLKTPYQSALASLDPRLNEIGLEIILTQEWGASETFSDLAQQWAALTFANLATAWGAGTFTTLRAQWWSAYNSPETMPVSKTYQVQVRGVEVDYSASEITLTFASEDALLQDNAWMYPTYTPSGVSAITPSGGSIVPIVQEVLGWIGRRLDVFSAAFYEVTRTADQRKLAPGRTYWDYLAALLGNYKLYCDRAGLWRLVDPSLETSSVVLNLHKDDNLISAEQAIDRDATDWYTAAIITWRDTTVSPSVDYLDTYQSTYSPIKVYTETIDKPYPGYSLARSRMEAAARRSRVIKSTAVADITAEPDARAIITTPDATLDTQVTAVTFRLPADQMDLTTRIEMSL